MCKTTVILHKSMSTSSITDWENWEPHEGNVQKHISGAKQKKPTVIKKKKSVWWMKEMHSWKYFIMQFH